ncbi:acyltransferase family protein [Polluticoccus soli]|uniref:acyltransferase family protein n=1 Tax=Polluticoccus soli TaxID=3034150 RepID=UPI0023E23D41|nr:acyltransferase [Flavipsychrobacter sp. JY13-12]
MDPEKKRYQFLDSLRGLAALLVVFHHIFTGNIVSLMEQYHLNVPAFFLYNFTHSGVELFFVLSGVVLLRPYIRTQRAVNLRQFYYRRFRRIYPPYLGALVFSASVIWVIHEQPTWYSKIIIPFTLQEAISQAAIFNFDSQYYNLAWWSLQIEVLFYLCVPPILYLFSRNVRFTSRSLWTVVMITLLCTTVLQVYLTAYYPSIYSYNRVALVLYKFIDYPVCFILGVYLAATDSSLKEAVHFIVAGVLLVLLSYAYLPVLYTGYGFIYAGLIIFAFYRARLRQYLEKPLLIWLGERSYSLFLTHFSVLYLINFTVSHFTPGRNLVYGFFTRALALPLSLFVAMLLFHFVERRYAKGLHTANAFWPWNALRPKEQKGEQALPETAGTSIV